MPNTNKTEGLHSKLKRRLNSHRGLKKGSKKLVRMNFLLWKNRGVKQHEMSINPYFLAP